ncbi:unnamed protein product [Penicillium salamii]|nr:unnamed protein product [Penicillium salamii]
MTRFQSICQAIGRFMSLQNKNMPLSKISIEYFIRMSDSDAVWLFYHLFKNELEHLKKASVTVESTTKPPSGKLGINNNKTPSNVLYGEDYPEVNRTLVSLLAIKWVLNDDYALFTETQKANKLSKQSFDELRDFYKRLVNKKGDLHALLVAMAIDDIGKDPNLSKELEKHLGGVQVNAKDHSDLVYQAANSEEAAKAKLIPSLEMVPLSSRDDILGCLHIGSKLNISQAVQGECPPASLQILSTELGKGNAINLRAMLTFLDVAGAAGHVDSRSCIVMTEPVFQAYMSALKAFEEFSNGSIVSPRACYDHIIETRAEGLRKLGFEFPSSANEARALSRLLCMGRVTTIEQANQFKQALDQLAPEAKKNLVNGLNVDGIDDGVAILPYYAPGLLADATKDTDKLDAVVIPILSAFFRFLARVFNGSEPTPGAEGGIIERDLSFVQEKIKSKEFRYQPEILDGVGFPWE